MKPHIQSILDSKLSGARKELAADIESLFSRCPALCGFTVRGEAELYVSDVGISPRISAEQYGEIFQEIVATLASLLDERPEASELLRDRTFARILQ
jgi:hypothetical protein